MRAIRLWVLVSVLLAPLSAAWAAGGGVDLALIESATTPEQHQALARQFRERASDAKKEAETQRSRAKAYNTTKRADKVPMAALCQQLATEYEEIAVVYEGLASGEDAAAKQ